MSACARMTGRGGHASGIPPNVGDGHGPLTFSLHLHVLRHVNHVPRKRPLGSGGERNLTSCSRPRLPTVARCAPRAAILTVPGCASAKAAGSRWPSPRSKSAPPEGDEASLSAQCHAYHRYSPRAHAAAQTLRRNIYVAVEIKRGYKLGVLVRNPTSKRSVRLMLSKNPYHWRFEIG